MRTLLPFLILTAGCVLSARIPGASRPTRPYMGSRPTRPPMESRPTGSPGGGSRPTRPSPPSGRPTGPTPTGPSGTGGGGGGNTGGGSSAEDTMVIGTYTWSQEPNGFERSAVVSIPETSDGAKLPVIIYLHGNGGQGSVKPFADWLGDDCILVAPNGYERSWNVFGEASKADDVQFVLDVIAKVGEELPQADMDNVNIVGSSNGAALTYTLLISTGADRPFRRAFPMVSSLISPQYHDGQFWKFSQSSEAGGLNDFDTAVVPEFSSDFQYAHFHGTNDGVIPYEGGAPAMLQGAEVIPAQEADYIWAQAMGFTGPQIADEDGVSVGLSDDQPTFEYSYLDGSCRHYKLVDEGHGTGPSHPVVQQVIREMVLGTA